MKTKNKRRRKKRGVHKMDENHNEERKAEKRRSSAILEPTKKEKGSKVTFIHKFYVSKEFKQLQKSTNKLQREGKKICCYNKQHINLANYFFTKINVLKTTYSLKVISI
ncbi:hypothetical protein [Niallia circulans]|uniref:hypothetical protein n=1 Tax=Niallia circulans TaxID=1397 RepID=UPI0026EB1ABC|nr:hypothetical protein [Niallia circulans]